MINLLNSFRFGLHKLNLLSLSWHNDKFERWTRQCQQLWPHINEFYGKAYWGARKEASIYQASIKGTIPGEKVNDIERYSSKNYIIINNLPLVHGTDYWEDVLTFFANYLNIKVERDSIVACHPLGPIHNPSQPPAFIVKFVYFDVKDRICGRKHFLRNQLNPTNAKPIFLNERLTKRDADLKDYLKGLGLKTSTYKCAPQVFIEKHGSKPKPHNIVDMEDVDSLLAQGSLLSYSKNKKTLQSAPRTALFNFTEGGQKQVNGKEKAN